MWYELDEHQKGGHLPSLYNAAMNNRAGWVAAADAIIKYHMPVLRQPKHDDSATEQVALLGIFAFDLVTWLHKFAHALSECWKTAAYKKARTKSGTAIEIWGERLGNAEWRGPLVAR